MEKLYDRIDFHNKTAPALNETNLNAISKAIDDIDNRLIKVANSGGGGGGGSSVEWNQLKKDGEKIAEITIDGETTEVFAPEGGSGASTWSEVAEKPFSTIGSGLTVENDVLIALGGGGSSIPWTYIKDIDLSGTNAVSIPEFANYDEFYIHSDTDFDILNQYFIKDVTQRINVGAFSSTSYYCLVLGTIDWNNKTIKKDAYAHSGWSTSCKFKLYGRKLTASGGSGGTSDYSELTNKPQINNVELSGNKSLAELNIASASDLQDLSDIVGTVNTLLEGAL